MPRRYRRALRLLFLFQLAAIAPLAPRAVQINERLRVSVPVAAISDPVQQWAQRRIDTICSLLPWIGFSGSDSSFKIERSLRVGGASAKHLSRTFGTPSDAKKGTIWFWLKRGTITGTELDLFTANSTGVDTIYFNGSADALILRDASTGLSKTTNAVLRDPTAFYLVMFAWDSTQATAANRDRLYINRVEITSWSSNTASTQNANYNLSAAVIHRIASYNGSAAMGDCLIAGFGYVDGLQLVPSDVSTATGQSGCDPIAYTGAWGNNGFYLDFKDNSAATSSTLGKDRSGNNNDWTPNNISVTAGTANDSLVDSPTNYGSDGGLGGEVRGNYCTWNPLVASGHGTTYSDANLKQSSAGGYDSVGTLPILFDAYWEVTIGGVSGNLPYLGVGAPDVYNPEVNNFSSAASGAAGVRATGVVFVNNTAGSTYTSYTAGDVVGFAFKFSTKQLFYRVNGGAWVNSGDPVAGTGAAVTATTSGTYFPVVYSSTQNVTANFGQRPFRDAAPTGYKALCTQNYTATTPALPGSFTGNASANGPVVVADGVVASVTINGNVATQGTHYDALAIGMKLRTTSTSYNASGSNTISAATYGAHMKFARAQVN